MKVKFSLKNKLFLVILCVLVFNVVLSFALGNTMFDKLYTNDKIKKLKSGVESIKSTSLSGNKDEMINEIINYESQNMTICLFTLDKDTGEGEIEYFSRQRYFSTSPFDNEIVRLIEKMYAEDAFTKLADNQYYILNEEDSGRPDSNISILSNIEGSRYVLMQTPKKFIREIADSAIKYSLYISVFTLLSGAAFIYIIADKTTKPIRQIQQTADKIANLNFSQRCDILTTDEIGLLSLSINNMADRLQEYVTKLKDDLIRQEKADKMTKQLIANVSHDFKTPLTLIMSYSEAILDMDDIDEETKRDYLNIIINEGRKMSEFVQELLKLSQLEGGIIKLEKSNFSINEIINDTVNKNSIIAREKNVTVEKDISQDSIVFADYFRIEQVFQNLYENAIKYCNGGGKVRVSTQTTGSKCRIKVFNTGNHIAEEDIENIFISFYRADKSRKNMGSYGLGLAIVKAVMDMHRERYGVANVDDGVEFWFELENVEMNFEVEE
ncbi:MAG: HAMP domain-containing sensor histidine kinase [Sedimentibacter sp.]|uniref:sensor histidine kinase n=1 Tax=Sedimentibacter sp. TaxID=1960295 RepID=UPI003158683C